MYDKSIPTPEEFFGQQIGMWHLTHDQVLFYMKEIAKVSNRAVIKEYACLWENRPLINLIFTSPENHKNLNELKAKHLKYADSNENIDKTGVPLVIILGYGVHGKTNQVQQIHQFLLPTIWQQHKATRLMSYSKQSFCWSVFKSRWIHSSQHLGKHEPGRNCYRRQWCASLTRSGRVAGVIITGSI